MDPLLVIVGFFAFCLAPWLMAETSRAIRKAEDRRMEECRVQTRRMFDE